MENKNVLNTLIRVAVIASAVLWLGCQDTSHRQPGSNPTAGDGQIPGGGFTGTGDGGGGGNGVNGKVYEAYIVDPSTLQAFKDYVQPILQKLELNYIYKEKTWYIAPHKLKPLSKDTLGLAFAADETEQLAVQTRREIWLNSDAFKKMSGEEQGKLLLHEVLMSVYFFKFKSNRGWCDAFVKMGGTFEGKRDCSTVNEEAPLESESPLQENDYANIRGMTGWIWQNYKTQAKNDIYRQLVLNDFDSRLFRDPEIFAGEQVTYPKPEFGEFLLNTSLLGKMPTECRGLRIGTKTTCAVELKEVKIALGYGVEFAGVQIDVRDAAGIVIQSQQYFTQGGNQYETKIFDPATKQMLYFTPVTAAAIENPQRGDRTRELFVFYTKVGNKKELYALMFLPKMITKVTREEGKTVQCESDTPKSTNSSNDLLVVVNPEVNSSYLRYLGNSISMNSVYCK